MVINVKNTQKQVGSFDCGLFALVRSEAVLGGKDPVNLVVDQTQIRSHLSLCLESELISRPFLQNQPSFIRCSVLF